MFAFTFEAPATEEMYEQIKAGMSDLQPKGLVVHLVTRTESGLRHTDVWETREDWERYRDEQVRPSVARALLAAGLDPGTPPPECHNLEVLDVLVGA